MANDSLPDIIASLKAMASLDPATVGGAASSNACRIAGNILDSALRRDKGPNATRGMRWPKMDRLVAAAKLLVAGPLLVNLDRLNGSGLVSRRLVGRLGNVAGGLSQAWNQP